MTITRHLTLGAAAILLAGCTGAPGAATTVTVTPPQPGVAASGDVAKTGTPSASATQQAQQPQQPQQQAAPAAPAQPAQQPQRQGAAAPKYSPDVANIQRALIGKGYLQAVTGIRDDATVEAIKRFQRDNNLTPDGEAGPAFWAVVNGVPQQAPAPAADGPSDDDCSGYWSEWTDAVRANSSKRAQAAHDAAARMGCKPDTWVSPKDTTRYDSTLHVKGDTCRMSQVGTYDGAGLVCTQDVEGHPHWNG